jgi:MoaA/NifB/PqqE/SkfB family radical SAM enzyme
MIAREDFGLIRKLFNAPNRLLRLYRQPLRANRARIEEYLSRPRWVEIETVASCNATCRMCPIPQMKRARGVMSDQLYRKVIEDLVEVKPYLICPFNNGEPLLDKKLVSRIAYINQLLPETKVVIYTNAALLTPEKIRELNEVRVDKVNVSFNAGTKESYERIMGLSFEQTVANVESLLRLKPPHLKVIVSMLRLPENPGEVAAFQRMWAGKDLEAVVWTMMDFGGKVKLPWRLRARRSFDWLLPPRPCVRVFTTMTVLYDGRAVICCRDIEGEAVLGDVSKATVQEVWNSPVAKDIRFTHLDGRRQTIRMCHLCPGYNWSPKARSDLPG